MSEEEEVIIITPPPKTQRQAVDEFNTLADKAFDVLGEKFDSPEARAILWAIGRQESRLEHRRQIGGPARGFWQFEKAGVKGVLSHKASAFHAKQVCEKLGVEPTLTAVYASLEKNDILAFCFARLLLWTDAAPLPKAKAGNAQEAWGYYKRNWRPGKPHPHTWQNFWKEAVS